jgi:hypothetical protein
MTSMCGSLAGWLGEILIRAPAPRNDQGIDLPAKYGAWRYGQTPSHLRASLAVSPSLLPRRVTPWLTSDEHLWLDSL